MITDLMILMKMSSERLLKISELTFSIKTSEDSSISLIEIDQEA